MQIFRRWLSEHGFYLSPDEGGGAASAASAASQGAASQAPASTSGIAAGGTGGATSTASSGAASSSTSAQIASPAASVPQGGVPTPIAATAATTQQPEWQSVVDIIKGYGATDLASQYANNEHGLLQHLLMERARAEQYTPVVQQLQQHGAEWQEFLRQKQAVAQKQADAPWYQKWFTPPEWNPAWERLITQDQNGNVSVVPGADPGLVRKYQEYRQYRQQVADKFLSNPYEFFREPVQHLAQQIAQQEVQRHLGGYQDRLFADQFVNTNPWLFQKDQSGQTLVDPRNGAPVLSPEGDAFRRGVLEAQQLGVTDVRAQQKYALALVQRDYAVGQIRALTPQQQQQQANQQFLQQAAGATHQGNVGPATSPAPASGNPPPPPGPVSFDSRSIADRMMRNMVAAGYTPGQVAVA